VDDRYGEHGPEQPPVSSGAEPARAEARPLEAEALAPAPPPDRPDADHIPMPAAPVDEPSGTGPSTPDDRHLAPAGAGGGPGSEPPAPSPAASAPPTPRPLRGRALVLLTLVALILVGTATALTTALLVGRQAGSTGSSPGLAQTTRQRTLTTAQVADLVSPAVVDINTVVQLSDGTAEAAGTGMIVTHNGYIVTNNHVVAGATTIKVTIQGLPGRYPAQFIGSDPLADVAVIKVDGLSSLPTIRLGNSSDLFLGQSVVAIGNALGLGGTPTVTTGTVWALGRQITASDDAGTSEHLTDMIETDAPIEPGNSGGPLVTTSGEVIGMNTAAASADGARSTSLGFALPINRVAAIADQIESGRAGSGVELGRPAFLGIDGQNVDLIQGGSAKSGVDISAVLPRTPAARAGLVPGDVIIAFDGHPTPTISALTTLIHERRPGELAEVRLESVSVSGIQTLKVVLAPGPAA